MKANLCLEAAERSQWPRLYSLDVPRSHGRIPSLAGNCGPVLQVLGWAELAYAIYCYATYIVVHKICQHWLYVQQNHEFFTDNRGRGEASNE